jgi:hypothetical protein
LTSIKPAGAEELQMSIDVEEVSVCYLKLELMKSEYLSAYINSKDKEPSYDGHIIIHQDKTRSKEAIKRVFVQVKGKSEEDFSKESISYPIEISDLKNYLNNGGVFLIVGYVRKNLPSFPIAKLYYASLTPITLKLYLEEAKGSGTKSITLHELLLGSVELTTKLLNFYNDCSKQTSFASKKLFNIEELEATNMIECLKLTVLASDEDTRSFEELVLENEPNIYAVTKAGDELPIAMVPDSVCTVRLIPIDVCANGIKFYSEVLLERGKYRITTRIGDNIELIQEKSVQKPGLKYKTSEYICKKIIDLSFLYNAMVSGGFYLGNSFVGMKSNENGYNSKNIQISIGFYEDLYNAFKMLSVHDDVKISNISRLEYTYSKILIDAFVKNVPVRSMGDVPVVAKIDLYGLCFMLVFIQNEDKTHNVYDFFKTKFNAYEDSALMRPVSQYSILTQEDYSVISNINYEVIVSSFIDMGYYDNALFSLLRMILGYDLSGKTETLNAAKKLAEWLLYDPGTTIDNEIAMLNYSQIIKREREFTDEEFLKLQSIAEDKRMRDDIRVGAYLLLGSQRPAELLFSKMSPDEQEAFRQYPIYRFWESQ